MGNPRSAVPRNCSTTQLHIAWSPIEAHAWQLLAFLVLCHLVHELYLRRLFLSIQAAHGQVTRHMVLTCIMKIVARGLVPKIGAYQTVLDILRTVTQLSSKLFLPNMRTRMPTVHQICAIHPL